MATTIEHFTCKTYSIIVLMQICFGESNHIILVWRVNIAIESGVVCVHDKVEVAAC